MWVLVPPPLPPMYTFLPGFEDIQAEPPHGIDPQLVFFFDSGNLERSGSAVRGIAAHATIINIDHHPSNTRFGDINVIEPEAAAVGQHRLRLADQGASGVRRSHQRVQPPIGVDVVDDHETTWRQGRPHTPDLKVDIAVCMQAIVNK